MADLPGDMRINDMVELKLTELPDCTGILRDHPAILSLISASPSPLLHFRLFIIFG